MPTVGVVGNVLMLRSTDGADLKLTLIQNATIVAVVKASMADIKEGTFLGSAAVPFKCERAIANAR